MPLSASQPSSLVKAHPLRSPAGMLPHLPHAAQARAACPLAACAPHAQRPCGQSRCAAAPAQPAPLLVAPPPVAQPLGRLAVARTAGRVARGVVNACLVPTVFVGGAVEGLACAGVRSLQIEIGAGRQISKAHSRRCERARCRRCRQVGAHDRLAVCPGRASRALGIAKRSTHKLTRSARRPRGVERRSSGARAPPLPLRRWHRRARRRGPSCGCRPASLADRELLLPRRARPDPLAAPRPAGASGPEKEHHTPLHKPGSGIT